MARGGLNNSTLNLPERGHEQPLSPPLPPLPPPTPQTGSTTRGPFANGPSYPSSWASPGGHDAERGRPQRAQHARRPSRAERYEALVENARELLERDQHHEPVGLGIDSQETLQVTEEDWREAVENLLKVVDGMARQLATHDELAAQLKIAQSNLTLAETHSEFLEETLRRRDSRSSAQMVARHSASGTPSTSAPNGAPPRPSTESTGSLFGLGFEDPRNSAASFFRMPSAKRKQTPSVVSNASSVSSLPPPPAHSHHTLRSSSSSPRLRTSSSSYTFDEPPPPSPGAGKTVSQLTSELFALHAHVTSLEQSCQQLKGTNVTLRRSADVLSGRCAELEKTKDDLMSELENLSMELFQEANTMVADERKLRAKAEEEVSRLRGEISSLSQDLEVLRRSGVSPIITLPTIEKRDSVGSTRTMLPPSRRSTAPPNATLSPPNASLNSSPNLAGASPTISHSHPSPDPSEAASATSSRKWFNFGRSGSVKAARSVDGGTSDVEGKSPNPNLLAPRMARADSGASVRSASSVGSSFFSATGSADEREGGERETLLDGDEQDVEDMREEEVATPLVSDNGRPRLAPLTHPASLYPLPPSPNPSSYSSTHVPPPALRIDTSPPLNRRDGPPSATRFQRSPAQVQPPSSFSTDSSPAASPRFASSRPSASSSLAARPVAIHSFEGQDIAKSPKSPNAMRWSEMATALPPAATSPRLGGGASPRLGGMEAQRDGTRSEESSRSRSTLLPSRSSEQGGSEKVEKAAEKAEEKVDERVEASEHPKEEATCPPTLQTAAPKPTPAPVSALAPAPTSTSAPRVPGHRPPPLSLSTSSNSRASPSPTGSTFSASAVPASVSRTGTRERSTPSPPPSGNPRPRTNSSSLPQVGGRPPFQRSISARSASSLSSSQTAASRVASPTYTLPSSGSGPLSMSTSTSLSSLRSPADDLEGLMRNIEDMNRSLFGSDDEEEEIGTEATRRER